MTVDRKLTLKLRSYWRPGTGRGSGSHVDALAEKDRYGCPFISGRMLKGLLRDATYRVLKWESLNLNSPISADDILEILFGSWAFEDMRPRHKTRPGLIRISDATLDDSTRQWLFENQAVRQVLYHDIYSTAISSKTGAAKQGSLRGEQVAVPLELTARWDILPPEEVNPGKAQTQAEQWVYNNADTIIKGALPLIYAIGAGRSRGLGRVSITMDKQEAAA